MSQLVCMNWSMHIVGWITTERPIRRFAKINSVVSCHLLCCCNDYGPSCFLQEYTTPWWIPYHLMIKGAKWVAYAVANSPCQGSIFIVLVAINVLSNRSSPRLTCFFFTQIWLNLNLKDLISDLYRFTVLVSLSLRSCVEHGEKLPSSRGYFFKELFDVFLCEFSAIPCCICMMISLHLLLLFLFSTVLQALWNRNCSNCRVFMFNMTCKASCRDRTPAWICKMFDHKVPKDGDLSCAVFLPNYFGSLIHILLMEEILHHQGCIKPCK